MQPEERLKLALARKLWSELHETGYVNVFDDAIAELGAELDVPDHLIAHATRQLVNEGWLFERDHGFFDGISLARAYGEQHGREQWRAGNDVCRHILRVAVPGYENPRVWSGLEFNEERCEPSIDFPFEHLAAATRILESLGYVKLQQASSKTHYVALTEDGYELARDDEALRRIFPTTTTEDEEAHTRVAPDVLATLITSCERLLRERSWASALEELARGDARHGEGLWADAVGEYYAAIESGLRYRIHDEDEEVAPGAALKKLTSRASELGLIPANYAALFGFTDSIRSPRSHGAALRDQEVEVGPAESLLMGNHARALLVYLGHRP